MEEILEGQSAEQTSDAFLDGWDGSAEVVEADQPAAEAEEVAEAEEKTEETPAEEGVGAEPTEGEEAAVEQPAQPEAPVTIPVTYLGEEKAVTLEEAKPLIQKGMDYDRVREKYDEAKPVMELFGKFAKEAGMTIPDYTAYIRQQAKQASGMSEAEAKRAVEFEDREAAIALKEQEQANIKAAETAKANAESRRKADISEFIQNFPDAAKDPKSIPQEVWEAVNKGTNLSVAYAKYAVAQANEAKAAAEQKATAQEQNRQNASRATGSMQSAGDGSKHRDPFLADWD